MNLHDKQRRKLREARASLLAGKPELPSMKAAGNEVKNVTPGPPGSSVVQAAPPVMLTPTIAWRRLCARTGCVIPYKYSLLVD